MLLLCLHIDRKIDELVVRNVSGISRRPLSLSLVFAPPPPPVHAERVAAGLPDFPPGKVFFWGGVGVTKNSRNACFTTFDPQKELEGV